MKISDRLSDRLTTPQVAYVIGYSILEMADPKCRQRLYDIGFPRPIPETEGHILFWDRLSVLAWNRLGPQTRANGTLGTWEILRPAHPTEADVPILEARRRPTKP